ncbi:ABC transporter ATP-binding protein [Psychrobacillus vulpis]|uniref:Dipeptide ABC transporter ATP-binding protein n=1 Tax=Psychrobacillus vulpis TaxID=2325572 RepID=A0A544TT25_9BACI|nr:dipeptide ABC transporter ATP-binding protein [Psychrobacillus vulpis]TQR20550.1 dipeptide ABC transporter ATP-binding protein [Psychrobacillus vulpis]
MIEREKLLTINHLKKYFPIKGALFKGNAGQVKAVDDVSFEIYKGETLGIVGESGSGKSTLGRTILRLMEPTDGEIIFEGTNLEKLRTRQLVEQRKQMQMIFQDPFASLNPRMRVGQIVGEPLAVQKMLTKAERAEKVMDLIKKVGLTKEALTKFPHEFSGGQRQRIGIARALSMNPKFIIADEPVSALDVSVQSQVLNLMMDLQDEFTLTYLFISHDLSVVKHISDRVGVMYLGRIVEIGDKKDIYSNPLHPYTQALLSAIPVVNFENERERIQLKGEQPNPSDPPAGCAFHTRCPLAFERCKLERPNLMKQSSGQLVACHLYEDGTHNTKDTSEDKILVLQH